MVNASKSKVGFKVPCPKCGALEGLRVNVSDLNLECGECAEDVSRDELQALIDDATRLLTWLNLAATL